MKLTKNGIVNKLTDPETIKIFLDAGWEEVQEVKATEKVEDKIVEEPKKTSRNKNK